jgi:hypothetical protein
MKKFLASGLLLLMPLALLAESRPTVSSKSGASQASRVKTKAATAGAGIAAVDAVLTPAELAIAERVYLGRLPCELGTSVDLKADTKTPGYFDVQLGRQKFHMYPVETTTGAVRLEDKASGAVWLQLANKSMLMNHKLGQRLADECVSPDQAVVAANLIKNPAPSVLDNPLGAATK